MKAVLISPGFGAGWSTWVYDGREAQEFALTYSPLIVALLAREPLDDALAQYEREYAERFGTEPYVGGARDLQVALVEDDAQFRVEEYDGSESLRFLNVESYYDARQLP